MRSGRAELINRVIVDKSSSVLEVGGVHEEKTTLSTLY